jgi:hypothetical protein
MVENTDAMTPDPGIVTGRTQVPVPWPPPAVPPTTRTGPGVRLFCAAVYCGFAKGVTWDAAGGVDMFSTYRLQR